MSNTKTTKVALPETNVAKFVGDSANAKISPAKHKVSATYASIKASCPSTCKLRDNGCYAQSGPIAIYLRKLDNNAPNFTADSTAEQEAAAIRASFKGGKIPQDGAKGGRDLRLHVFGDATTIKAAMALGEAARNWREREGGDVWTYTHAWKNVPRTAWGSSVSVLASIDDMSEAVGAVAQGYAPAVVVSEHKNGNKVYSEGGIKWIPCVAQVTDLKCTECRLCFKADMLASKGYGIAFSSHGSGKAKINKRLLNVIQGA